MTAFARLLSESCQRGDARPTLALVYDRGKSSNRGSQARTRVGLRICDGHFLAVVPHQTASLLAEDLVEPGSFVTAYPILHFFTEYDAPIRRPSGMLVCSGPAAFEPAPMMKSSVPPNAPVTLLRAVLRGCPVILGGRHKSGTHSPCEVGVEGCGKGQCNNKQSSAGEVRRRSTKISWPNGSCPKREALSKRPRRKLLTPLRRRGWVGRRNLAPPARSSAAFRPATSRARTSNSMVGAIQDSFEPGGLGRLGAAP
jgi:hypothetical protein